MLNELCHVFYSRFYYYLLIKLIALISIDLSECNESLKNKWCESTQHPPLIESKPM